MEFETVIEVIGKAVDAIGVGAMVLGAAAATITFARRAGGPGAAADRYTSYRQGLGRAILVGLELLVAADIIRTVAVTPTFESVGVLAIIVLIRTFLSFTLQLEIDGRLPWQKRAEPRGEGLPT